MPRPEVSGTPVPVDVSEYGPFPVHPLSWSKEEKGIRAPRMTFIFLSAHPTSSRVDHLGLTRIFILS